MANLFLVKLGTTSYYRLAYRPLGPQVPLERQQLARLRLELGLHHRQLELGRLVRACLHRLLLVALLHLRQELALRHLVELEQLGLA